MLPGIKIGFANGAIGSVAPNADGVIGLAITGVAVVDKFTLATPYQLFKIDDLKALGITDQVADANSFIYKTVKEFYDEAGEGAELWLMAFPDTTLPSAIVDLTKENAKSLLLTANGRIRSLVVAFKPAIGYTSTLEEGLDSDVKLAKLNAQALAEWATQTMYAPIFVILEARGFKNANIATLADLTEESKNRVALVIGDTITDSDGSAVGLLAGRIARNPVQRHIGRVRDGAIKALNIYIEDKAPSVANVETLNNKGYITFRKFTGKAGYFFTDDNLASMISDDYAFITRRRVVDKAYRIAYQTLLEYLIDELPLTNEGSLVPAVMKSWEQDIITAIVNQMTSNGELGADPTDANDNGVKVYINPSQNVVATSRLQISLKVKPYAYAKYIDVELGFYTNNE